MRHLHERMMGQGVSNTIEAAGRSAGGLLWLLGGRAMLIDVRMICS